MLSYSDSGFRTALENIGASDLDQDGTLEFGGQRYTVDFLVCSDSGMKVSIARKITSDLRSYGIDVNLRELGYDDYVSELRKGNFDMYYAEVRLCADWDLSKHPDTQWQFQAIERPKAESEGLPQDFSA